MLGTEVVERIRIPLGRVWEVDFEGVGSTLAAKTLRMSIALWHSAAEPFAGVAFFGRGQWVGLIRLDSTGWYLSFVMKDTPKPDKHCMYDAAFRAEAWRLVGQSRSTQAARTLNIDPKRIC